MYQLLPFPARIHVDVFFTARNETQDIISTLNPAAIVYLIDERYETEEEWTKKDIHSLLNDSRILTRVPFMVLVLTETGSESASDIAKKLDLEDRITPKEEVNEGRPTALFVASLPLNKGYQEAFEWLSTHM
ncbi:hypothetical protein H0H92_015156 [Tricholoma furcatifolium]|nr:hypothetical protein H0H92_015156 [Tricholoma furcatifolium]